MPAAPPSSLKPIRRNMMRKPTVTRESPGGTNAVARSERRNFLTTMSALAGASMLGFPALAQKVRPEKEALKFGFIKLTDMVPLAIAYEKKFFEDEGLFVTL